MEFYTKVTIKNNPWQLSVEDKILLLGSCFSTNMADKMKEYYMRVTSNPAGTLYNPISIAHHMEGEEVENADVIIITFGTSWVYELDGKVVDNCQKRPANLFTRRRLTIDDIVQTWKPILDRYAKKRFIFTVSPIRHIKDGLHENQISKAILLQAIDELHRGAIARISYFPAYEIMLDELRDYRFYAEDMLHPSAVAINYLWERFRIKYMYKQLTADNLHSLHQLWLDKHHKILHPDSEDAKVFEQHVKQEYTLLAKRFSWLNTELNN
ncbi:MAG: GSCFA domain-containing protein [Paludibacteraceae bacterium]|nr:GSCFA domain-containing protein [Paludibacteraceae bacterium]